MLTASQANTFGNSILFNCVNYKHNQYQSNGCILSNLFLFPRSSVPFLHSEIESKFNNKINMAFNMGLKHPPEHSRSLGRVTSSVMDLSSLFFEDSDLPTIAESEVSSDDEVSILSQYSTFETEPVTIAPLMPKQLQWEFHGLTLFLELEEFENDISNAINDMATFFNVEEIPKSHATAIYGMTHLTADQARQKLHTVKDFIGNWPKFARPTAVVQDIAIAGRPGQVCSIAWCELTLSTNDQHEEALDKLYSIFYEDTPNPSSLRHRPWKPHNSLAYDNPEDNALSLEDVIGYVALHPSLITKERRVEAISLWDMNGKMGQWKCLDRVYF